MGRPISSTSSLNSSTSETVPAVAISDGGCFNNPAPVGLVMRQRFPWIFISASRSLLTPPPRAPSFLELKVLAAQSHLTLTVTHQALLFMGFSRQEYWIGLPFPFPVDLPDPGIKPGSFPFPWNMSYEIKPFTDLLCSRLGSVGQLFSMHYRCKCLTQWSSLTPLRSSFMVVLQRLGRLPTPWLPPSQPEFCSHDKSQ